MVTRDSLLEDIGLALDLDRKPEREWSAYEKRRMRRLSEPLLVGAAPLFEEERDSGVPAYRLDLVDPLRVHWPRARAALSTHNHPMDSGQIGAGHRAD